MGLMKISTYYRQKGDDVRFIKGGLTSFATRILFEQFYETIKENKPEWRLYFNNFMEFIKTGKDDCLQEVPNFLGSEYEELLTNYRSRFKRKDYKEIDIICVTTLFTFYWKKTIQTIKQAKAFLKPGGKLYVGGIAATILPDKLYEETGIYPHVGLLDKPTDLDKDDDIIIDELPLDYSILDEVDYEYPANDAYFGYMTRGCIRHCEFCVVPKLEPEYKNYVSIKNQIKTVDEKFGPKRHLLLMDNNVFASNEFDKIIDEIKECGFGKNDVYKPANDYELSYRNLKEGINNRAYINKIINIYNQIEKKLVFKDLEIFHNEREKRYLLYPETAEVEAIKELDYLARPLYASLFKHGSRHVRFIDFNQGVDARLVTEAKMKKLAETNIKPLRIAFDHYEQLDIYLKAINLAAKYGIKELSNYLLYNFHDTPEELFERLKVNVNLCEELNIKIYSFPMKYHPIDNPLYFDNRDFIGEHWNRKFIRAVQAVLNSTKGKIGRGKTFFEEAFGHNQDEYYDILWMPEALIINRFKYKYNLTLDWRQEFNALKPDERLVAEMVISENIFTDDVINQYDGALNHLFKYYQIRKDE